MIRCGFTLIELVISLAIAAIVSISLTMLLQQSYASQTRLEAMTHLYARATLIFTQLERDLMGATIPIENILALEEEAKKKNKKEAPPSDAQAAAPKDDQKKSESEVPYKPVERVFYYARHGSQFYFSWITHNPLQLYWGSSVGVARPRFARVMYRLEPDPTNKTVFKLMRSEGFDVSYTPYEKHADQKYKGSMIADGVKSMTITCIAVQEKQQEKDPTTPGGFEGQGKVSNASAGETKKSEKPPELEVKKVESWEWPRSEKEQKEKDTKQQELPPLPQGVRISLVLWDAATDREVHFESAIAIPALPTLKREGAKSEPEKPAEPDKGKGATPPAGGQPNPATGVVSENGRGGRRSSVQGNTDLVGGVSGMNSSYTTQSLFPQNFMTARPIGLTRG